MNFYELMLILNELDECINNYKSIEVMKDIVSRAQRYLWDSRVRSKVMNLECILKAREESELIGRLSFLKDYLIEDGVNLSRYVGISSSINSLIEDILRIKAKKELELINSQIKQNTVKRKP
ncbi:hypothetical protein EUX48_05310 [Haemophilus haemolyticus]|uniref:Uncharacterized protein n=1 Tax=Haemophilus haemolyticus TaxID=726 RepID=A0A502LMX4_HAEHA|nr:hypothetical protein [Haemophilus haemolyticus]TPH22933.1 hypothetical protein EUX48_05310 [Haemophilus haemolyticus]